MGASCDEADRGIGVTLMVASEIDAILSAAIVGTTATISINIPGSGQYEYHVWLSDSATDPTITDNLPSQGEVEWTGYTDSSGDANIAFVNNNAQRTWYIWATFLRLNVSSAVTVGTS